MLQKEKQKWSSHLVKLPARSAGRDSLSRLHEFFVDAHPHFFEREEKQLLHSSTCVSSTMLRVILKADADVSEITDMRADIRQLSTELAELRIRHDSLFFNHSKLVLRSAMTYADELVVSFVLGIPRSALKTHSLWSPSRVALWVRAARLPEDRTISWLEHGVRRSRIITEEDVCCIEERHREFFKNRDASGGRDFIVKQGNRVAHADPRFEDLQAAASVLCGLDRRMLPKVQAALVVYGSIRDGCETANDDSADEEAMN